MSRYAVLVVCCLALALGAQAQVDDLDALLAGLGEDEAVPAAAAPSMEQDPFADLLGEDWTPEAPVLDDAVPAAADDLFADMPDTDGDLVESVFVEEETTIHSEPLAETDPFADLLGGDSPVVMVEEEVTEMIAPDSVEAPFDDLFDGEWDSGEETSLPDEETTAEAVAEMDAVAATTEEDPFDDLFADDWAVPESEAPAAAMPEEMPSVEEATADPAVANEAVLDLFVEEVDAPLVEEAEATLELDDVPAVEPSGAQEVVVIPAQVEIVEIVESVPQPVAATPAEPAAEPSRPSLTPRVADQAPEWDEPVVW
ncbi:MAG: hypothetical protein LBN38_04485 [Verrucomicrobiota bacterium]|nr:hypothetical protein [Verrucomicrobiota bacterium]